MEKFKKVTVLMVCLISLLFFSIEVSANNEIIINTTSVDNAQCQIIWNDIRNNLEEKYKGLYSFDNYNVTIYEVETTEDKIILNVDVLTDMILIRHPSESPLILGMIEASDEILDVTEKAQADQAISDYLVKAMEYYKIPVKTGFEYQVHISKENTRDMGCDTYQIYHRQDIAEENPLLCEMVDNEKFVELATAADGAAMLEQMIQYEANINTRSVRYSRSTAVEYATDHALDAPEFNKENGGSDCANFVSKCLNAGGIPTDKTGKWYPATTYGDTDTCGINWMRTGFTKENGGVVIYMSDKKYFSEVDSSRANTGSIMFWNDHSHVALVTMCDGTTIKYTQHSNTTQTAVYRVYDASTMDITFYRSEIS